MRYALAALAMAPFVYLGVLYVYPFESNVLYYRIMMAGSIVAALLLIRGPEE